MKDRDETEPQPEKGVAAFAKRALGAAAQGGKVVLSTAPGVRFQRKHRTAPARSVHACVCTGCHCTRISGYKMPCLACSRGRHVKSKLNRSVRRELAGPARSMPKRDGHRTPAQRRKAEKIHA